MRKIKYITIQYLKNLKRQVGSYVYGSDPSGVEKSDVLCAPL